MDKTKKFLTSTHCSSSKKCTSSGTSDYSSCSDNSKNTYTKNENSEIVAGQIYFPNQKSSDSSNYSTCSDNPRNAYVKARDSQILSGQMYLPNQRSLDDAELSIVDYSVNCWEKNIDSTNIDILVEDKTFVDCEETNEEHNDTTSYLPVPTKIQMQSNNFYQSYLSANNLLSHGEINKFSSHAQELQAAGTQTNTERHTSAMKETEVTHTTNSIVVKKKPQINTGDLVVHMIEKMKNSKSCGVPNGNCIKRVLFATEDNVINDTQETNAIDKPVLKSNEKNFNSLVDRYRYSAKLGKDINKNSNSNNYNANTTESFVMWEKYFESSEKLPRRSLSLSELNSITESYGGDDEHSTSFQSLDDTDLSSYSLAKIHDMTNSRKEKFKQRNKSCDDLLKEVKHLPHMIYQRFLKCLSKEIDNMLKQNIICTCQRPLKKRSNKENNVKEVTYLNKNSSRKENQLKESKLTPDSLRIKNPAKSPLSASKLSPKNSSRISPKSPKNSASTRMYGWKTIVSPVGEYIRGKRQSPFQSSPNKKKV